MTSSSSGAPARLFALVPCAGIGERAGAGVPKQYAPLAGRPLVAHTLAALLAVARLQEVLVVLSPRDRQFDALLRMPQDRRCVALRCGGESRAASVAYGLAALRERGAEEHDWVLVHDAARCLLQPSWVDRLIEACERDEVGGLLALPLADTLKRADPQQRVAATVDRAGMWAAQTPQMFRLGVLARALAVAGTDVTDEAGAIEALGLRPRLVPGDADNFKVTWPQDLQRAERLLRLRAAAEDER